jgi:hypothetical protein
LHSAFDPEANSAFVLTVLHASLPASRAG